MKFQKSIPFSSYIHSIQSCPFDPNTIALGTSNEIQLLNSETLQSKGCLKIKDIFQMQFNQNGLWYSNKQQVALFDVRSGSQVRSWTLSGHPAFLSFSINASETVLCAGTELQGEDAHLAFWDLRMDKMDQSPMQVFSECHSDDITQVVFHPKNPHLLCTGSTDGLVNLFDLSVSMEEDDALYQVIRDDSIHKLGFFGPNEEYVYTMTHIETFSLYKFENSEKIVNFGDVRGSFAGNAFQLDYLMDCIYDQEGRLYVVGGSFDGNLGFFHVTLNGLEEMLILKGNHENMIKSVYWNESKSIIYSGDDEGILSIFA